MKLDLKAAKANVGRSKEGKRTPRRKASEREPTYTFGIVYFRLIDERGYPVVPKAETLDEIKWHRRRMAHGPGHIETFIYEP